MSWNLRCCGQMEIRKYVDEREVFGWLCRFGRANCRFRWTALARHGWTEREPGAQRAPAAHHPAGGFGPTRPARRSPSASWVLLHRLLLLLFLPTLHAFLFFSFLLCFLLLSLLSLLLGSSLVQVKKPIQGQRYKSIRPIQAAKSQKRLSFLCFWFRPD